MENSCSESMKKAVSDEKPTITVEEDREEEEEEEDCFSEESGWTAYFQDFSDKNRNNDFDNWQPQNMESDSVSCTSSSLLSDAASYAAWKNISRNNNNININSNNNNYNNDRLMINDSPKKLSFKKTRANQVISEDDFEDTASSPVNSPKVGDLLKKTKVQSDDLLIDGSMVKRDISGYYSGVNPKERSIEDFNGKIECTDLKNRGLCLVPLSMLMNFHG